MTITDDHHKANGDGHEGDGGGEVVVATDLRRHFTSVAETIHAVDGVSLTLRSGELAVLAGRSGSGKSTLLNLLLAWDRPDAGSVEHRVPLDRTWSGQAVVPQGLGLLPELTARQNIDIARKLGGGDRRRVDELITLLELDDLQHRRPAQLSLGEQQRTAIARAVLCDPKILIADEPTAHQDERRARLVMQLLRELVDRGGAVLVASHDEAVLDEGDRRFDLDDGRLV